MLELEHGFAGEVEPEQLLVSPRQELDGLGLPLHCRRVITGLGTGGRQRIEALGAFPVSQLTGHRALLDGSGTVAKGAIGAGGK